MVGFRYDWLANSDMSKLLDYLGSSKPPVARFDPETWEPPVDVYETTKEVVVQVELPGLTREDISVSIEGTTLTIKGERTDTGTQAKRTYCQMEIRRGFFEKYVTLPAPVDPDRTTASYKNGILDIVLAKTHKQKTPKVRIKV